MLFDCRTRVWKNSRKAKVWLKMLKLNKLRTWNLTFSAFTSPVECFICENLKYESVFQIKELHKHQGYNWPTTYRAGTAVVSTVTSFYVRPRVNFTCVIPRAAAEHLPCINKDTVFTSTTKGGCVTNFDMLWRHFIINKRTLEDRHIETSLRTADA